TAVIVTTNGEPEMARQIAQEVATTIWEMREQFRETFPDPDTAVAQALTHSAAPVVIAEISDNSGGGAPGDGTYLLRALLAANAPDTAFGFITDAEAARAAHEAGAGATIFVSLGGKLDAPHGVPIKTKAYVKVLTDGRFRLTNPMGFGSEVSLGPMARLIIGNVDVLVASQRAQAPDPEVFLLEQNREISALPAPSNNDHTPTPVAHATLPTSPPRQRWHSWHTWHTFPGAPHNGFPHLVFSARSRHEAWPSRPGLANCPWAHYSLEIRRAIHRPQGLVREEPDPLAGADWGDQPAHPARPEADR
ncbi:MAG: MlrC C-terminal domain-containing protein, partial [Chloroflexota bacterium]|nr:MlrC C-terminal domain-containing protein [Chloroflexota bacterium]